MMRLSPHRLYWAALALILLAGLVLRFYRFAPPGSRADPAAPLRWLPPGLDSDEAFHALAALRLTRGEIAPFFKIDQGLPAAMIYLIALVFQFTGPVAEGGRLASTAAGVAVLVAAPALARLLFPQAKAAALLAAAQVAFIFWFVNFSRIGLEQMLTAAMVIAALAACWLWQTRGGVRPAVTAGLALGLALYSYPAAYFTPIVAGLWALHARTLARPVWKVNGREAAAALAAFALSAAPLALFFIHNPDWAARRSTQVAAGSWTVLYPLRTLGALVWRGDVIVRHNIPGRPLLDPIQGAFLVAGLVVCARRWREAPFALLLIWFAVMLMPAAMSDNPEHFGRLSGAVAAAALIAGLGGAAVWSRFPRVITGVVLAGCVAASGLLTTRDYFLEWPRTPGYLDVFDFAERVQAEAVASLPPEAAAYVSPSDRSRPMFAFLWGDALRAQSYNGRLCAVFPERAERETAWFVNTSEETHTADILSAVYPALNVQVLLVQSGTPVVTEYRVPSGTGTKVTLRDLGRVGDLVELAGLTVGTVSPGASTRVDIQWRVVGTTSENWTVGLYLLDSRVEVKAQDDRQPCDNSYPTSVWQAGEIIDEERLIHLPPDLPPGSYTVAVAYYRLSDGLRLPALAADGRAGTLLPVAEIAVP